MREICYVAARLYHPIEVEDDWCIDVLFIDTSLPFIPGDDDPLICDDSYDEYFVECSHFNIKQNRLELVMRGYLCEDRQEAEQDIARLSALGWKPLPTGEPRPGMPFKGDVSKKRKNG